MNQSENDDEARQLAVLEMIYSGISDPDIAKLRVIEEVYKRAQDPIGEFNARLGGLSGDPRLGELLEEFNMAGHPEVTMNYVLSLSDQGVGTRPSMASFAVFAETSWRFWQMVPHKVQIKVLPKYFNVTRDPYTRRLKIREKAQALRRKKKPRKKKPTKARPKKKLMK